MAINHSAGEAINQVLRNHAKHSRAELLKALYDLRYNTSYADEDIVFPLLEHSDDGVVASALFTLWHGYGVRDRLISLIRQYARGDERDMMDMPIQTMAITLLAEIARSDLTAHNELVAIAEDQAAGDSPRKTAWMKLAEQHGVEWLNEYSDEMIWSPDSEKCEGIRQKIRQAIG